MFHSRGEQYNSAIFLRDSNIIFLVSDFTYLPIKIIHEHESAMVWVQLALKGNGRWDSDWFIAGYAQNRPITH